jgi:hypothetical protein
VLPLRLLQLPLREGGGGGVVLTAALHENDHPVAVADRFVELGNLAHDHFGGIPSVEIDQLRAHGDVGEGTVGIGESGQAHLVVSSLLNDHPKRTRRDVDAIRVWATARLFVTGVSVRMVRIRIVAPAMTQNLFPLQQIVVFRERILEMVVQGLTRGRAEGKEGGGATWVVQVVVVVVVVRVAASDIRPTSDMTSEMRKVVFRMLMSVTSLVHHPTVGWESKLVIQAHEVT